MFLDYGFKGAWNDFKALCTAALIYGFVVLLMCL